MEKPNEGVLSRKLLLQATGFSMNLDIYGNSLNLSIMQGFPSLSSVKSMERRRQRRTTFPENVVLQRKQMNETKHMNTSEN